MYQIREITLKNASHERKVLAIDFDNPAMAVVGEFLMADAGLVNASVLDAIDRVISGEADFLESSGNRCGLKIKADQTLIYDLLGNFDDVDTHASYEMDTRKLRELIVMWLDKVAAFDKANE